MVHEAGIESGAQVSLGFLMSAGDGAGCQLPDEIPGDRTLRTVRKRLGYNLNREIKEKEI